MTSNDTLQSSAHSLQVVLARLEESVPPWEPSLISPFSIFKLMNTNATTATSFNQRSKPSPPPFSLLLKDKMNLAPVFTTLSHHYLPHLGVLPNSTFSPWSSNVFSNHSVLVKLRVNGLYYLTRSPGYRGVCVVSAVLCPFITTPV